MLHLLKASECLALLWVEVNFIFLDLFSFLQRKGIFKLKFCSFLTMEESNSLVD